MAKINKAKKVKMLQDWVNSLNSDGVFTKSWEQVVADSKKASTKKK